MATRSHTPHALEPVSELDEPEGDHTRPPHSSHHPHPAYHHHHLVPAQSHLPSLRHPRAVYSYNPTTGQPRDHSDQESAATAAAAPEAPDATEAPGAPDTPDAPNDPQAPDAAAEPEPDESPIITAIHSPPPPGTPPTRPALRSAHTLSGACSDSRLRTSVSRGRSSGPTSSASDQRASSAGPPTRVRFSPAAPTEGWTHSGQRYDRHGGPAHAHLTASDVAELKALQMDLALLEARWAAASHRAAEKGDPMPDAINVAFGPPNVGYQPTSLRIASADARGLPRDNFPTGPNREQTPTPCLTPSASCPPSQSTSPTPALAPSPVPHASSPTSAHAPTVPSPPATPSYPCDPTSTPPVTMPLRQRHSISDFNGPGPRSPPHQYWITSSEASDTESAAESVMSESDYRPSHAGSRGSSPARWQGRRLSTDSLERERERALYLGPGARSPQPNRRLGRKAHAERVCLMSRFGLLDAPTPPPLPGNRTPVLTPGEDSRSWVEKSYAAPPPHVQPRATNAHSAHTPWMGSSYTGSYVSGRSPLPSALLEPDSPAAPGHQPGPQSATGAGLPSSPLCPPTTEPGSGQPSQSLPQISDAAAATGSYFPPQPDSRPALGPRQGSFTQPRAAESSSDPPATSPVQCDQPTTPTSASSPLGKRHHAGNKDKVAAWTSVGGKRVPLVDPPTLERKGSHRDRERMERERLRARIRAGAPRQTPLVVPPPEAKKEDSPPLLKGQDLPPPSVKKSKPAASVGATLKPPTRDGATRASFSDAGGSTDITSSSEAEQEAEADEQRGRSRTPPRVEEPKALAGRRDPSTGRLAPTDLPVAAPAAEGAQFASVGKWTNRPSRSWTRKALSPGTKSWSFSPRAASVHSTSETEGDEDRNAKSSPAPPASDPAVSAPSAPASAPPISGRSRWSGPSAPGYDSPASEFYESGSEYDACRA